MFIKLTQVNYPDIKVRIAVDKIIFYMPNPKEPTGSIIATIDGQPTEIIESVEEIDEMINPTSIYNGIG